MIKQIVSTLFSTKSGHSWELDKEYLPKNWGTTTRREVHICSDCGLERHRNEWSRRMWSENTYYINTNGVRFEHDIGCVVND